MTEPVQDMGLSGSQLIYHPVSSIQPGDGGHDADVGAEAFSRMFSLVFPLGTC